MKKFGRKAFTIVELVIVIAVVAILAAVLIPTFTGIVNNANKSADMQEIASINVHLATLDEVDSGEDLYDAIAEVYGENKAKNFSPRSASEGYHYWYDVENKTVVLKLSNEIKDNNANSSAIISNDNGRNSLFGASTFAKDDFATIEANSFRMFRNGKYYLLDNAGSAMGEALNALETGKEIVEKVTKVANLSSNSSDKQVAEELLGKLETIAIVGNDSTFVYNSDKVEALYFVSGVTTISNNVNIYNGDSNYIAKAENLSTIILPESITSVKENSLMFNGEGVIIKTALDSVDDIVNIFQANSTNAIIEINADRYIIDGNAVKDTNGNAINGVKLEFGNPVKDFDISIPSDTDFYKSIKNNIYVAYNYADEIELSVGNFVGENQGEVSSKEIVWTSNNAHVNVEDGIITLANGVPALENCTATITAKAVAGEVAQSVTIYIVRPREATFSLAGLSLDMVKNESLSEEKQIEEIVVDYTGKDGEIFAFNFNPVVCYPNEPVISGCDTAIKITEGNGDVFQIYGDNTDGYTLELINPTECAGLKQTFTITIGTALTKTFEVSVNDISATPFAVKEPFASAKFLYRVGNGNSIKLGTFFENGKPEDEFTLSITDVLINNGPIGLGDNFAASLNGSIDHTWTFSKATDSAIWENWADATLKFNGTGVANIKLGAVSITVEVVDAYNVMVYSELVDTANNVLLNDIKMSNNSRFYLSGARFYGNGFTFDVTEGNYTAVRYEDNHSSLSDNYRITLDNAILDNVRVEGNPFNSFSAMASGNDNICNVYSLGDSKIINSFISYCAAPVRLKGGSLEIINTTLLGGSIANLDIRGGNVILDNVTTINQKSVNGTPANEGAVGFGVIAWYEGVDTTMTITIKNKFTQYNYMSEQDFKDIPLSVNGLDLSNTLANAVFGSNSGTEGFIYTDNSGKKWINVGIFSMSSSVGSNNIKIQSMTNASEYAGSDVSYSMLGQTANGYLFSKKKANVELSNPTTQYQSVGQGIIYPSFTFDIGKNYQAKVDGDDNYCYIENGVIKISFAHGGNKEFSLASLCTAIKGGKNLILTNVYIDGEKFEGNVKTFDSTNIGDHEIKFIFDDPYNYDAQGNSKVEQHSYVVNLSVVEALPNAKHAQFTFGASNTATEKVTIGNNTYISATGVSATDKQWGYITVDGQNIFYPIINAEMKKNALGNEVQVFYYVFNGAVTITDYSDGGIGAEMVCNASTTTMPSNLSVVNGMEAKYTDINSACVNISKLTKDGPSGEVWDFSASTTVSGTTKYNGYLAHSSPSGLSVKTGTRDYDAITVAQFCYTDNAGATYYYFVGYFMPNQVSSSGGSSSCVTPDTLITLADGTQKRVDQLTGEEKLLVWNLERGCYDEANIVFIDSERECEVNVIHLLFSDGSEVKIIDEHGFFDIDLAKYVYIDESNYSDYIGHRFVKEGDISNNEWSVVTLESVSVEKEITTAWSPVTIEQLCYYTNGILSMPGGIKGLFNIFEVDTETMAYDAEKMAEDIAKYGLFTLEDFGGMIPEEAYIVFNGDWLKVAIGKGILTWEDIARYAERYIPLM